MKLVLAIVIFALIGAAVAANARGSWPTVAELEAGLSATRGGMLPKQVVTPQGVFNGYYVGASARGNGRYSVEIQLTR